ncbi:hypothetical protein BC940DRAFT_343698, partial [Gongronella butleri]
MSLGAITQRDWSPKITGNYHSARASQMSTLVRYASCDQSASLASALRKNRQAESLDDRQIMGHCLALIVHLKYVGTAMHLEVGAGECGRGGLGLWANIPPNSATRFGIDTIVVANVQRGGMQCPEADCLERFGKLYALEMHMIAEHNADRQACHFPHCTATFTITHNLLAHIRTVHTPNMWFPCTEQGCWWVFPTIEQLQDHLVRHELERYQCPFCNFGTHNQYLSSRHVDAVHPGTRQSSVRYTCPVCNVSLPHGTKAMYAHVQAIHHVRYDNKSAVIL